APTGDPLPCTADRAERVHVQTEKSQVQRFHDIQQGPFDDLWGVQVLATPELEDQMPTNTLHVTLPPPENDARDRAPEPLDSVLGKCDRHPLQRKTSPREPLFDH